MIRRVLNIATFLLLTLCIASAALWARSHHRGGFLYGARFGMAAAADGVPGEISFWFARVDRRCVLPAFSDSWDAASSVSAREWLDEDDTSTVFARGRFGYARCARFPDAIPTRLLAGRVTVFVVPFWFVVAATGVVPLGRAASYAVGTVRARRRRRVGQCPRCGYDLRAQAAGGPCPECGNEEARQSRRATDVRAIRRRWAVATVVVVFTATAVAFLSCHPASPPPVSGPADSPGVWLRRAVAESFRIERPVLRLQPLDVALRGQFLLGDTASVPETLGAMKSVVQADDKGLTDGAVHARLAEAYAWLGDRTSFRRYALPAERAAESAEIPLVASVDRQNIASGYAAVGDFDSVIALAGSAGEAADRIRLLGSVGDEAGMPNGNAVRARMLQLLKAEADRAPDARTRAIALAEMAELHLRSGDTAAATAVADSIPTPAYRSSVFGKIGAALRRAGDGPAAESLFQRARDLSDWKGPEATVFDAISRAQEATARNDRPAALRALADGEQAAGKLEDESDRVVAYLELAAAIAKAGDLQECRRLLARAEALALRDPEGGDEWRDARNPGVVARHWKGRVAGAVAGAGDLAWATEIAEALDGRDRDSAYFSIVNHLITRGDLDAAERVAREKVTKDHSKYFLARFIARAHAERRALDRVEKWVASLPTPAERGVAMIGAAEGLSGKSFDEPLD